MLAIVEQFDCHEFPPKDTCLNYPSADGFLPALLTLR
jgi:hypothetical protein